MFKVGQKYRILKPFLTGAREYDEIEELVSTCVEIIGVDADDTAWFNEFDDGRKDWIFDSDVRSGCLELVEEEDVLEDLIKKYKIKTSRGRADSDIHYYNDDGFIAGIEDGFIDLLKRGQHEDAYIKFPVEDLEQVLVLLTMLLEDK